MYSTRCASDQLHQLLSGVFAWTDELWEQAEGLAWDGMTVDDARQMLSFVDGASAFEDGLAGPPTRRPLRVFQMYPVAVFLGAYELMRHRRDLRLELEELSVGLR